MGRGLTGLISIKVLNSLSCIAVGSYAQVFLCSKEYFYTGFPCRCPVSLKRGQTFENEQLVSCGNSENKERLLSPCVFPEMDFCVADECTKYCNRKASTSRQTVTVLDFFKSYSGTLASPPLLLDIGYGESDDTPAVQEKCFLLKLSFIPYPTAFPYGNGMVLHFYQQQESSTTKTVHKVINKRLKTYV